MMRHEAHFVVFPVWSLISSVDEGPADHFSRPHGALPLEPGEIGRNREWGSAGRAAATRIRDAP